VQSSSQIITTNKPTPSFLTGQMAFLSPDQKCQSTEGKRKTAAKKLENVMTIF